MTSFHRILCLLPSDNEDTIVTQSVLLNELDFDDIINADELVNVPNSFDVVLNFPFDIPSFFHVELQEPATVQKLFELVSSIYYSMYQLENDETPWIPESFGYIELEKKECEDCIHIRNLSVFLETEIDETDDVQCSICYNSFSTTSKSYRLTCQHRFHHDCIKTWLKQSNTCPLCRSTVICCEHCDGLGFILTDDSTEEKIQELIDMRDHDPFPLMRPTTMGQYRIHSLDFEDLVVKHLIYDRLTRHLHVVFDHTECEIRQQNNHDTVFRYSHTLGLSSPHLSPEPI